MLTMPVAESGEGAPKLLIQWLSCGGKLIQNILNEQCEYFIDLPMCRHCDLSGFDASGVEFHVDCCVVGGNIAGYFSEAKSLLWRKLFPFAALTQNL